jgi:hypothetical protein
MTIPDAASDHTHWLTSAVVGNSPWITASLMSALGQKQTSAHVRVMSALAPKADIN